MTKHLFIDGTFHHPKTYNQLLIILFKDIIISQYLPVFYILMTNNTEILYDIIFKSVKNILSQYDVYELEIQSITTDTEISLINSLNNNFDNFQRLGCWFHLKNNLISNARTFGLLNPKSKTIKIDNTEKIISELSILPLKYKGDINYVIKKIEELSTKYPEYKYFLNNYFIENKLKYFEDNSFILLSLHHKLQYYFIQVKEYILF